MIVLDRNELMSTRMSGSEVALGTMTCDRLGGRNAPHLLIGGYGMGFTLRAVLARLGRDARVTVAELVPGIIEWARGPMVELTAGCLDDPRVTLAMGDVGNAIYDGRGMYDAILLDVDNGPDGLTRPANDGLYSNRGWTRRASHCGPAACWPSGRPRPTRSSPGGCRVRASWSTK